MELIILVVSFLSIAGLVVSFLEKKKYGIITFGTLVMSVGIFTYSYFTNPKTEKIIPLTEIKTETGVVVKGYYSESLDNVFVMTPNHVNYVKITYPRFGSLDNIEYELLTELEQTKTN